MVFHEPVDVNAYPSYAEKVDEPMDFGTIKSKLDRWEYRRNDPLGFQRDVRLVRKREEGDGGSRVARSGGGCRGIDSGLSSARAVARRLVKGYSLHAGWARG